MTNIRMDALKLPIMRGISAFSLFTVFGMANESLSEVNNTILAFGRSAIWLIPLSLLLFRRVAMGLSLLTMTLGALLIALDLAPFIDGVGALLFAYGSSTSGYLMRLKASVTKLGSAKNKVAMNIGSLCAGLALMIPVIYYNIMFYFIVFLSLIISLIELFRPSLSTTDVSANSKLLFKFSFAWTLCGISIGIMNFGLFSVLPQYLIGELGQVPFWYGIIVILNSLLIVVFQVPFVKFIEHKVRRKQLFLLMIMIAGFGVMAFPQALIATTFAGAVVWITLLTISECSFSYLDYYAYNDGTLLVKEISVGAGAAITVFISRMLPYPMSTLVIGAIGILSILIFYIGLSKSLRAHD